MGFNSGFKGLIQYCTFELSSNILTTPPHKPVKQIGIPIRKLDIRIELDRSCNVGLKMAIKAEKCSL